MNRDSVALHDHSVTGEDEVKSQLTTLEFLRLPRMMTLVKKIFAAILAVISGFYVFPLGLIPDPLPLLDEGVALLVFVHSMSVLGIDVRRWIPFLGKKGKTSAPVAGKVVDV